MFSLVVYTVCYYGFGYYCYFGCARMVLHIHLVTVYSVLLILHIEHSQLALVPVPFRVVTLLLNR